MGDYIKRDDVLNYLPAYPLNYSYEQIAAFMDGYYQCRKQIAGCPSYDTVEVVRCKDCEYLTPSVWQIGKGHCCRLGIYRSFGWFCADGKKREES